jgi:hypothetical protein
MLWSVRLPIGLSVIRKFWRRSVGSFFCFRTPSISCGFVGEIAEWYQQIIEKERAENWKNRKFQHFQTQTLILTMAFDFSPKSCKIISKYRIIRLRRIRFCFYYDMLYIYIRRKPFRKVGFPSVHAIFKLFLPILFNNFLKIFALPASVSNVLKCSPYSDLIALF